MVGDGIIIYFILFSIILFYSILLLYITTNTMVGSIALERKSNLRIKKKLFFFFFKKKSGSCCRPAQGEARQGARGSAAGILGQLC
jgi:hypothetical protein